ncbi:TetR-like C-terminal domain-containing protein, partial [Mycolicibacterium sp. CBMA 361]
PQHYQVIFGTAVPASLSSCRTDLTVTGHATSRDTSFQVLCASVRRMIDAGRIRDDGEAAVAGRIWSICHGAVTLEMAGFFGTEGHGLRDILSPLTVDFLVGMGDERDRAEASLATAVAMLLASGHL